jgi:aryl-alcohol dehydrogenase
MTYACENFNAIAFGGGLNDGTRRLSVDGKQLSHFFAQSSFARNAVVPENIAVPLPPDTALEKLSPLSCGVQTGSGAVMNSGMKPGATVAIIGCGGVGLSAVMGAKVVGASEIIAVDTIEERLSLARELGATHTINPKQSDTVE